MKSPSALILSTFLCIINFTLVNSEERNHTFYIFENQYRLRSEDFGYPYNNDTINVVWQFSHSISLDIEDLHLNGHFGDFLLVSEYPLVEAEQFENCSSGSCGDSLVEDLANSIVTNQGILLSWKVSKQIEAINKDGTFVLFHAEGKDENSTFPFQGFDINVENYDDSISPTTLTPPDPILPDPSGELYISKFLNCMEPMTFYHKKDDFKAKVAKIATEYWNERNIPLERSINATDVNIPTYNEKDRDRAGIHYCDPEWDCYSTCVEVTFAITYRNSSGFYLFPAPILEDMWKNKSKDLENGDGEKYCPFEPPEGAQDLSALGWLIFLFGIILGLLALFCLAWLKNARKLLDYKLSFTKDFIGGKDKTNDVIDDKPKPKIFDEGNPIFKYIPKSSNKTYYAQHEESREFPEQRRSNVLEVDGDADDDYDAPFGFRSHSFTKNPTFQDVSADVYAYDNDAFNEENDHDPHGLSSSRLNGQIPTRRRI